MPPLRMHAVCTPRHPLLMPLPLSPPGRCRSLFYTAWEEADALGLIDATEQLVAEIQVKAADTSAEQTEALPTLTRLASILQAAAA